MLLKAQMADDLRHDFTSCACRHGLLHEIAWYIDEQSVTPENLYSLWLPDEMRLMGQHDRRQPTGLGKGNESTFSGDVARKIADEFEECGVVQRGRKRHPLRLLNVIGKVRRISELCPSGRNPFPKSPGTAIGFPQKSGSRVH